MIDIMTLKIVFTQQKKSDKHEFHMNNNNVSQAVFTGRKFSFESILKLSLESK